MLRTLNRIWIIRMIPWVQIIVGIFFTAIFCWGLITGQVSWVWVIIWLAMLGVLLFFNELVICQFDQDRRMVLIRRFRVWRTAQQTFAFDDIHSVSVERASNGNGRTYRLVFVLNSGESIPLTNTLSSGKRGKERLAKKISAYVSQTRITPINAALDGIVRVQQSGVTDEVRWQVDFVRNNGHVPLTRWQTTHTRLRQGFLLIIPAAGAKQQTIPGGLLGPAVRLAYGQYLRMLDLEKQDLPGFEKAEFILGGQIGLSDRFAVLTSDLAAARNWLNAERKHQLAVWGQDNHLQAGRAASDPHILVKAQGLWIVFRGHFNQENQVAEITRLGTALARATEY